ncbi:MAG TPA: thiopeptide-type bacteriocin biosynthesis protein [Candidatus Polarisedimenticolaceae bacterium]|nr:thiopeptide-type bacteriocin biosynthesis protein [Candidatus Polarisedimenticolaceae bacterium]
MSVEKPEACLYAAMTSPAESHDRLLHELVAPVVAEIREHPDLDSLFFVRYADPEWQLRFRVLGRPEWVDGFVRPRVEKALRPFVASGAIGEVVWGEYAREWERYGGPAGMRLAEKIFFHDSVACLEFLESEKVPRREYSLVFTERFLDLFHFDDAQRTAFYRTGHEWAFRDGVFRDEDRPKLERRYDGMRDGLRERVLTFGDETARAIAGRCLEATRPVVDELLAAHAAGHVQKDLVDLAWSYTHLHCNRLGIDVVPEAILRYLMYRLYAEGGLRPPSARQTR